MWYLYIIEAKSISKNRYGKIFFYTGVTNDLKKRWHEHRGRYHSNWMRINKIYPRRIVYLEPLPNVVTYDGAQIREKQIKRLSHVKKQELINVFQRDNYDAVLQLNKICRGGM